MLTNGQAVGRVDGNVIFVRGPLPGERARVKITECKARYAVAELVELLERSPDRVEPFCGVFGRCGGCQLQHWSYPAQLAWKREVVVQALRRIGGFEDVAVAATVGMAEPRAYRNKMSLVVGGSREQPQLGFYEARSHDLVPIETCPIVLPALQADLRNLRAATADPQTRPAFEDIRHVVVRRSTGGDHGVMALASLRASAAAEQAAPALMRALPGIEGLTNSFAPTNENVVLGRRRRVLAGEPMMEERLGGARFRVSVQSFFQVNTAIVEEILARLRPHFSEARTVLDLYCGAGTFAVLFALWGAQVLGLEESPQAVEEARENAAANGVADRTRFVAGKVEAALREPAVRDAFAHAEAVFLDPPRKGSDEQSLRAINAGSARTVWYLSCNPSTLARDAAILAGGGFRIADVQPFDMFPQTGHIEVLMALNRS